MKRIAPLRDACATVDVATPVPWYTTLASLMMLVAVPAPAATIIVMPIAGVPGALSVTGFVGSVGTAIDVPAGVASTAWVLVRRPTTVRVSSIAIGALRVTAAAAELADGAGVAAPAAPAVQPSVAAVMAAIDAILHEPARMRASWRDG
jgi:hypothetical protein